MLVTNYAIKFRTAVFTFAIVAAILGARAYVTIPREGMPDITIPYVFMTAPYEGVAPSEIENLVTIPIEKQLKDLANVDEITSQSAEGAAVIVIKFTPKENLNNALQRVKDKIDMARPDLPRDLDEPIVEVFNMSTDFAILTLALSGDVTPARLKNLADDLQEQIEAVAGVKQVDIYGTREREIRVEVDPARLVQYRTSLGAVMRAIAGENSTISAGSLEMAGGKFQVRVPGEFELVPEMKDIVVAVPNGRPVYLTDVARIVDTYKDETSISRLNGKPCVTLEVKRRSGENTVAVIRKIKAQALAAFHVPPRVELTVMRDQSKWVAEMLTELENNIFSGFVLVVVVLMIVMGFRNSLFVGLAIPLSMLLSFVVMQARGMTLNFIVLFSLVMAVGMLVDNAIVIVENVFRLHSHGLTRAEAARQGASEVAWPVTTSTLTTVVAFWPLLAWPDIMGQFMSFLPRTLIVTLFASLFVALVVNPPVCSVLIGVEKKKARPPGRAEHPILDRYERILRGALRHRGMVILFSFAFFILTFQLYARFGRGIELFPDVQPRSASVQVKYPQGTDIAKTDAALRQIEQLLPKYGDISFYQTTVGAPGGFSFGGTAAATHAGNIYIEFVDFVDRKMNSFEIVEKLRKEIGVIPGAEVKVEREKEGPPTGAPVSLEIAGDDFDTLSYLSAQIMRAIKGVPGVVDLQDDFEEAKPEIQFVVDRKRAALLGLGTDSIGSFLRSAVYGAESSKFRAGEDEYDITVRLPRDERESVNLLNQVFIPLDTGRTVPLSSLGEIVYAGGRGDITRKNQKRVITISGDIEKRSIDDILRDIHAIVDPMPLPPGYTITYSGENEDINESSAFLSRAFGIAVALIFTILVVQFNSIVLPAIIMLSVVMSMIGVMWGLMICRLRFGIIMTGIGVISLAGVVVNNAIVLIDCILRRREEGLDAREAVVEAGRMRLRPVLLTAVTTILGLVPMAVGWSLEIHQWPPRLARGAESGSWWAPMAVAVIFGLALATLLTLVYVPVVYTLLDGLIMGVRKRLHEPHDEALS